MSTIFRTLVLAALLVVGAVHHDNAIAAPPQVTLTTTSGSHSVRVTLANPCTTDPYSGLVKAVTGAGAKFPGAVAVTTLSGDLLQAAAWSGDGEDSTPTTIGCDGRKRYPAGAYVVTVLARGTVRISTLLDGPATVRVTAPSRSFLRTVQLTGMQAATSSHEEQPFSTPSAAVAVFSESLYSAYVTSTPSVCIRRNSGPCGDGIAIIFPGAATAIRASFAIQHFAGSGFGTFEEQAVAARTRRTDMTLILPR